MMKQLQIFLTTKDETRLSGLLRSEFPGIYFLNDNVWPDHPDFREGVENCDSGRVYLYRGFLEEIPTMRRKDGQLEGPIAGCVVQVLRPITKDGILLSGRVAAGIDDNDERMREFVSAVWKCVKQLGRLGVLRPDGKVDKHYLLGLDAREKVMNGYLRIADRAVRMDYLPIQ